MNRLAAITIGLGLLVIIARAPAVLFPRRALEFLRRLIESSRQLRAIGVFFALYGVAMIVVGGGDDGSLARFIVGTGWAVSVMSLLLLVLFPTVYRGMAGAFLDVMEGGAGTRAVGIIGAGVGVVFVLLGISAL